MKLTQTHQTGFIVQGVRPNSELEPWQQMIRVTLECVGHDGSSISVQRYTVVDHSEDELSAGAQECLEQCIRHHRELGD